MKSVLSSASLYTLLVGLLCWGLPGQSIAQLTIENNTSCTVYLQASQVENSNPEPCTPCNVSAVTAIPAGGTWVHPGDASCGHFRWLAVRWYTHITGPVAVSYNPVWNGDCGTNARGGRCNGGPTTAIWDVPSSPGPATVTIRGN